MSLTTIQQLIESAMKGTDCLFALRDAFLEAGFPVLAEHYGDENELAKLFHLNNYGHCFVSVMLTDKDHDMNYMPLSEQFLKEEVIQFRKQLGWKS